MHEPPLIPEEWRQLVIPVLDSCDQNRIEWTIRARNDWELIGMWDYEAYDALKAALSDDSIRGWEVQGMRSVESAYEFFFHFNEQKLYGKIGLKDDRISIKIISTHLPNRDEL